MKALLLTVGGSDTPVVKSIGAHRPDLAVFFCSETVGQVKGSRDTVDGAGLVCKERVCEQCGYRSKEDRPNIITQSGLREEQYLINIVEPDNPYDTYIAAIKMISRFLAEGQEVLVDYTGGTKSMSAGLAAASMEFPECSLSIVKGPRLDLLKVRDGMERVAKLPVNLAYIQKQKVSCRNLLTEWYYHAAAGILEDMGRHGYLEGEPEMERLLYLCLGFRAWDKFDFREAIKFIDLYKNEETIAPYYVSLKKINATLDWYRDWQPGSKKNPPGFILVYDVLLNARRRAKQGNYDDAVARIYRALEMYAQFCLRTGHPRLTSEDIDTSLLPEEYANYLEPRRNGKGKIMLGLKEDYDLLVAINHPVGPVWQERRSKILDVLQHRNFSFLAHGMTSLSEPEYREMADPVWQFISDCDQAQGFKEGLAETRQLPKTL